MASPVLTRARGGRESPRGEEDDTGELHRFECCVSSVAVGVDNFG